MKFWLVLLNVNSKLNKKIYTDVCAHFIYISAALTDVYYKKIAWQNK